MYELQYYRKRIQHQREKGVRNDEEKDIILRMGRSCKTGCTIRIAWQKSTIKKDQGKHKGCGAYRNRTRQHGDGDTDQNR